MRAALQKARSIDVHAHVVLAQTLGAAGAYGPEIGSGADGRPWFRIGDYRLHGVAYRGSPFMDAGLRIEAMNQAGIDFQVLSPNPLTYFHFIETAPAVAFCRRHNDALRELVARYPQRLAGLAALPMQDIGAACEELTRAVGELGLLGAGIGTDIGRHLDSPEMDRFYQTLVRLDVPLFLHPAPAGIDGPRGDSNLNQYELDILTGFAAQETIAVATLIFGGVLQRHPQLDICISHAGGAVAVLLGRLNRAARLRPWAADYLRHDGAFEDYLSRLWFDAHVHDQRILDFVIRILGSEQLLLGTNFSGWDQHKPDVDRKLAAQLADNARRLLRA